MKTGPRRILVTALLGALVGLGAFLALLGRRPRKRGTASAQDLAPITIPAEEARGAKGGRGVAVGLVALLLVTGLSGIIYESRDTLVESGSPVAGGGGRPLAAQQPSTIGSVVESEPAPKSDLSPRSVPALEPDGQAGASAAASSISTTPEFDMVRVEPNGSTVVTGRASPNSTIELLVDGRPVATARTGGDGRFTTTPPALPSGSSEIGLRSRDTKGGVQRSPAHVAVVVPPSQDTAPLVALISPDTPTVILSQPDRPAGPRPGLGAEPERQANLGKGDAPEQPGPDSSGQPAGRPAMRLQGSGANDRSANGAQAGIGGQDNAKSGGAGAMPPPDPGNAAGGLKPADRPVAATTTPTKIVSIDAQDGGKLFVTARAGARADLRLYLNDTLIAPATVGRDGTVTFTIGHGVRPGGYKVRLDSVDPTTGKVHDRAEVPFSAPAPGHDEGVEYSTSRQAAGGDVAGSDASVGHERPADARHPRPPSNTGSLAANSSARAESGASEVYVPEIETARIERGDSLWRVSRRTYGVGERYTLIYDANQDQIRDPDLIYPGQVFVLPNRETSGAGRDGKRD